MSDRTPKHKIVLTADQRQDLERMTRQSTADARIKLRSLYPLPDNVQ